MLQISFEPESNTFAGAAKEYEAIWLTDGQRIVTRIEDTTGLQFKGRSLSALVYEGISQSHPLKLRASYDQNTKRATLVHELLHIISAEYRLALPIKGEDLGLGLHKQIDLLLYDLWAALYGQKFAGEHVKIESARTPVYREAWDWALSLSPSERKQKFAQLVLLTAG